MNLFYIFHFKCTPVICRYISLYFLCSLIVILLSSTSSADSKNKDLQNLYQLTIDLKRLDQFFHYKEISNRKPLAILKNNFVLHEPDLVKFGLPVKFISPGELEHDKPYFKFIKVDIQNNIAIIRFIYPVEGVVGNVVFERDSDAWIVACVRLVER